MTSLDCVYLHRVYFAAHVVCMNFVDEDIFWQALYQSVTKIAVVVRTK